jgi:ABC-type transport system substrate-binding protein
MSHLGLNLVRITGAALVALASAACSSSSSGSTTPTQGDGGTQSPTFTNVYTTILQPTCSSHHAPGGDASFLNMSTQSAAYSNLVGVKASGPECASSGETRVVAGNASESLLFQKVNANPKCGGQMPLDESPISSAQITLIENWINAGALNN